MWEAGRANGDGASRGQALNMSCSRVGECEVTDWLRSKRIAGRRLVFRMPLFELLKRGELLFHHLDGLRDTSGQLHIQTPRRLASMFRPSCLSQSAMRSTPETAEYSF